MQHSQVSHYLLKIAKLIEKRRKELLEMEKILDDLAVEQSKNIDRYRKTRKILDNFESEIGKLDDLIREKERSFDRILQEQFAAVLAIDELNSTTKDSIFMREYYEASKKANDEELVKLRYIIKNSSEKKKELQRNSIQP